MILRDAGWIVEAFSRCEDFLALYKPQPDTCVVLDVHFRGMGGLEILRRLGDMATTPPIIVVSGSSGIPEAVQSMKQGAMDFIEKPLERDVLLACVGRAFAQCGRLDKMSAERDSVRDRLAKLTARQREVMDRVLDGQPSKNIAADLKISQRTVENHRHAMMHRTGAPSLPALARMVMYSRGDVQA
jgi:two-component system CheB/CheR fusion protein